MNGNNLKNTSSFLPVLRLGTILISVVSVPAILQIWQFAKNLGHQTSPILLAGIFFSVICVVILNSFCWFKFSNLIDRYSLTQSWSKIIRWLVFAIVLCFLVFLIVMALNNQSIQKIVSVVWSIFWSRMLVLIAGFFLLTWIIWFFFRRNPWKVLILLVLISGSICQILNYFPFSMNYPFSLDWSESSWFYYASFFHANQLYGSSIPWPFLDIGKPLLLSPIYLIPNTPLWLMRVWQFTLWIGVAVLVSWLFQRRTKPQRDLSLILFLWVFIWMLLGPVYFHLGLSVALILWKFNRNKFLSSIIWVGIASIWSGALRINWIPVPAMLALTLYFMETPKLATTSIIQYLKRPAIIGFFGLLTGAGAFAAYGLLSGRLDTRLLSKFSASFLTYRLWPNATLQTGIILGALIVSCTLLVLIYSSWRSNHYSKLRGGLILTMLTILFAGGVLASLKIGGGNNLHNLDAFLVLLMFWGGYALTGRIKPDQIYRDFTISPFLLALVCLIPVLWTMQVSPGFQSKDMTSAQSDLVKMQELVQSQSNNGDSILFVYQRHLLTFGKMPGVPLVKEYELLELMEMAMSNNKPYLVRFQQDLQSHRFGLIVMAIERGILQDRSSAFSEENNAWVENVYIPLMQYYKSVLILPSSGIEIFAPK
jgi:hypothetical protein